MIVSMYAGWPLTKLEIADGFYAPWCAILRYVIDHFAVGAFVSFAAVCIAHAIFWGDFISGAHKASAVALVRCFVSLGSSQ